MHMHRGRIEVFTGGFTSRLLCNIDFFDVVYVVCNFLPIKKSPKTWKKHNGIMHFIGRVRSLRFMAEVSAALVKAVTNT